MTITDIESHDGPAAADGIEDDKRCGLERAWFTRMARTYDPHIESICQLYGLTHTDAKATPLYNRLSLPFIEHLMWTVSTRPKRSAQRKGKS